MSSDVLAKINTARPIVQATSKFVQLLEASGDNSTNPDLSKFILDFEEEFDKAANYRWTQPKTQQRQDRHLGEYRRWILPMMKCKESTLKLGEDAEDGQYDKLLFPSGDDNPVCELIMKYLLIAADYLASKMNKDHPSMLIMIERRESLIFWANRKCHKPPPRNIMISRTDPVMLFARKKYDMNDPPSVKIYFGRSELVQLLDFDMNITTAIEVAEQHHLAWTISWVCGIRPSSIGTHPNSLNAYMKWEDFEITRLYDKNDQPIIGGFVMLATIAYLKKGPKPNIIQSEVHTAKFAIYTPNLPQNVTLSPTYRMLTMLLRRGYLYHYTTPQELLFGKHHTITIKPGALELPIFIQSVPGGRGLNPSGTPSRAASFSEYMSRVAHKAGFPEGCTMYAWRKEAGTNIADHVNIDVARKFMTHAPGSSTFQDHYESNVFQLDVFALAAGENPRESRHYEKFESPALRRADIVATAMLRKRVVDEWVENQPTIKELRRHPLDYHTPDGVTLKNELRRLRLLGSRALDAAARDEFKINRTVEEIAARRSELRKASNLMNIISIRAQRMKATHANVLMDADEDLDDQDDENEDNIIDRNQFLDIEDDTIADHDSGIVQVQRVGEDVDYDASLPIHYLVLGFMEHLLEPRTPPGQPRKCPLCQVEEYVSVEHKAKLWANLALMTIHLDGTFHNGYNTWLRKYQEENLTKSGFPCPYGCGKSYKDLRGLIKHITTPINNDSPEDKQHHELVKEDGWFRDDWKEDGMDPVKRESKRSYARDNWRCKRAIDSGLTTPHPPAKYLRTGEYITIEQPAPGMLHNQLVEYGRRDGYLSDLNIELSQMMPQPTVSLQAQLQYMQSHSPLRQQLPLSKELEVLKDRYQGVVANSVPIKTLDCKRLGAGKL